MIGRLEQEHLRRYIAKEVHISVDIGSIRKRHSGQTAQAGIEESHQEVASKTTEAFKLFEGGSKPIDVAIKLDLGTQEMIRIWKEYCDLKKFAGPTSISGCKVRNTVGYKTYGRRNSQERTRRISYRVRAWRNETCEDRGGSCA